MREASRHIQRLQKTLEDANIKLDSVISDVMGLSGRRMIEALIPTGQARGLKAHGQSDPEQLAQLAHRRIKACPGVGRGRYPRSSAKRCAAASRGITASC